MACDAIVSQFEIRLCEEILQDLLLPGKVFKHDLTDIQEVGRVDHTGVTTGTLPTVQLEKISDAVIRLLITVHRSKEVTSAEFGSQTSSCENGQIATQTSSEEWTKTGNTQTNSAEFSLVVTTQTDGSGCDIGTTQTDSSELHVSTTQTDNSASTHGTTQTCSKEWMRTGKTQTNSADFSSVVTTQTDDSGSNAGSTQTDGTVLSTGITQTESLGSHFALTQTDNCGHSDGITQTYHAEWLLAVTTQTDNSLWLCAGSTQTDLSQWLQAGATQTNNSEWTSESFTQWDSSEWLASSACQTEMQQVTMSESQTIESRIGQSFANIGVETLMNLSTQVDIPVQATADVTDNHCQVSASVADVLIQVSADICNGHSQTDRITEVETQSQTDMSIAWQSDCEVQATVQVGEFAAQAAVETVDTLIQACAETVDCDTQAVVEMTESVVQATVDLMESTAQTVGMGVSQDCQTDTSMSRELNVEVQAVVEMSTVTSQTELNVDESSSQTEEQNTEVPDVEACKISQEKGNETEQTGIETELPSGQEPLVSATFDDIGSSLLPQSISEASVTTAVERNVMDGCSQTDPVTIIIGDASFLVKKLKSSAVSPSKVITSGNEIEIEVNPDIVGGDTAANRVQPVGVMPAHEEKENEAMSQKMSVVQGVLAPGGVMMRGGPAVGPRLRMPVSAVVSATQQQVVVAARTPGGLLVRHPAGLSASQVHMAPVASVPTVTRGPHPVVGGSMSCPFCALAFIDSPALYEHLSNQHAVDQKTKWRQPRGREGKTIIPQKRGGTSTSSGSGDQGLPVLFPIESINVSAAGVRYRSPVSVVKPSATGAQTTNNATARESGSGPVQEAGLFEDPIDPEVVKKSRGRQPKSSTPSRSGGVGDSDVTPPPAKRQRTAGDGGDGNNAAVSESPVRKGRPSAADNEKKNAASESPLTTSGGRRGGRSSRGQRK